MRKDVDGIYSCYYEVTELGEVYSKDRTVSPSDGKASYQVYGRKLKQGFAKRTGYMAVRLSVNGKVRTRLVHRLIATAFVKNPNKKPEVNHKDGDKLNNSADNLEWVTSLENKKHAYENGLGAVGSRCASSKLGEVEVKEIKQLLQKNYGLSSIARRFGVNKCTISDIKAGRTWRHV